MPAGDQVEHIVILVPGIRDFGKWKKVIAAQILAQLPDMRVYSTNIGFFGLLQFLLPLRFLRQWAIKRIFERIREVKDQHPKAAISFIAHSFGSYCVANILKSEFDVKAHRVIFCGSVVPKEFPFNLFHQRFTAPILNDVGTADPWPAVAEAVAFGCGSIGTFGYGDTPFVTDRFHNGAGHGYFFKGDFATRMWVPFLRDGTIVPGSAEPADAPRWIDIIGRIHIKLILAAMLAVLVLFGVLKLLYPAHDFYANAAVASKTAQVENEGEIKLYKWSSLVATYVEEARAICPWGGERCPPAFVQRLLWARDYGRALQYNDDLLKIASCTPYDPGAPMYDPFEAIEGFAAAFPHCMSQTEDPVNFHWLPGGEQLKSTPDASILYCGCSPAAIAAFSQ